jgi:thiol-disulfide isomerase/thioredoxin
MKNIILILGTFFLLNQFVVADLVITGQILTYDDKAPKMAHISYKAKNGELVVIPADSKGFYTVKIDADYNAEITFSAVDHISITQKFPIPENLDSLSITSKLIPNQIYNDIESISILGDFNDRDFDEAPQMKKNSDGKYYYEVKFDSDTLSYQIFPKFEKNLSERTFNGSQSDYFVYDMGGDYNSVIIDKSRKFNIVFDPNYYPQGAYFSSIEFSDEQYNTNYNAYNKIQREFDLYIGDRSMIYLNESIPNEEKAAKSIQTKKEYLDRIAESIALIKDKNIRLLGILDYIHVAHDGVNVNGMDSLVNNELLKEMFQTSPDSDIWAQGYHYYQIAFAEILLGNIENPKFAYKILESDHPKEIKAGLLSVFVHYCHYNELEELEDKYYTKLQAEYPETKEAMRSRASFGKDKNIMVGKTIPDFKLTNLDNDNEIITPKSLRGKYVLVDIWGTWCMPCLMEIPFIVDAYEKFKDKNFTVFSIAIDGSASVVRKFRETKNKLPWLKKDEQIQTNLPWLHSYAGNWESEIISIFEVVGVPTTFLIDPDGKIIDTSDLRGEGLIKTLEKYIK